MGGDYPKDISVINDLFDDGNRGAVDYANWLASAMVIPTVVILRDHVSSITVAILSARISDDPGHCGIHTRGRPCGSKSGWWLELVSRRVRVKRHGLMTGRYHKMMARIRFSPVPLIRRQC